MAEEQILFTTRDASKRVLQSDSLPPTSGLNWSVGDVVYNGTPGSGALKMGWVYTSNGWKEWGDVQ